MKSIESICVDDPSSYPPLIKTAITKNLPSLKKYFLKTKYTTDIEVCCALEINNIWKDEKLEALLIETKDCLNNRFFEGFHNTRVLSKEELLNTGLQVLTAEPYLYRIRRVFTQLGIDKIEQDKACAKLSEYLYDKHGRRTNTLSFYAPYSLSQDYWKFTENIGGEICKFGLSDNYPDVYAKLTSNGYPITVKILFPFLDVVDYHKDRIAFEFIRHYAAKLIPKYDYRIVFDGALDKTIQPSQIIDIFDFIDNYRN